MEGITKSFCTDIDGALNKSAHITTSVLKPQHFKMQFILCTVRTETTWSVPQKYFAVTGQDVIL